MWQSIEIKVQVRSSWCRCTCDDDKRAIKRRKDNKGAIADAKEPRAVRVRGTTLGSLLVVPNSERAHGGRRHERGACVCVRVRVCGMMVVLCLRWEATLIPTALCASSRAISHREMPLLCAWWGAPGAWCVCVCVRFKV